MKHYRVRGGTASAKVHPRLLFDVKFDLCDMRSRTCRTLDRSFVAEWIPVDDDLMWARDMVAEYEASFFQGSAEEIAAPAGFAGVGIVTSLEDRFLQYLLLHHRIVVQRNTSYNLYSSPSESVDDFRVRCLERALYEMSDGFCILADRCLRRLLHLQETADRVAEELESSVEEPSQRMLELHRVFLELREEISALCLSRQFGKWSHRPVPLESVPEALDLREKLQSLVRELQGGVGQLQQSCRQRAEAVEPFQLPLTLQQISIAGTAVLWQ